MVMRRIARYIALTMVVLGVLFLVQAAQSPSTTNILVGIGSLAVGLLTVYGLKSPEYRIPAAVFNVVLAALGIYLLATKPEGVWPGIRRLIGAWCFIGGGINATALYSDTVVITALRWTKKHPSKVMAVVAALLIAAIAVVWTMHSRIQAQRDAQTQLTKYQTSAEQAEAMKGDGRSEAVRDVLSHLDGLAKSYPDTDVAPQALLQAAELLRATGQPEKAARYYERLLEMPEKQKGMNRWARRGLAASLEAAGDAEKAIVQYKALEALAAASAPQEAAEADCGIGRCYEILKDPENAKSFYRKAIESDGESNWADLARSRIVSLELRK